MAEIKWLPVPVQEYSELYEVSDLGDVRRIKTGRILKPSIDKAGYKRVNLSRIGETKAIVKVYKVHRLVAMAFIPNPENKPQIDHIDGNPRNNAVPNLRWATASENQRNPISSARKKYTHNLPEVKAKLLARINTPEYKAKQKAAMEAALKDPIKFAHIQEAQRRAIINHRKRIQCIETGEIYNSVLEAAEAHHVSPSAITQACNHYETGKRSMTNTGGRVILHFRRLPKDPKLAY